MNTKVLVAVMIVVLCGLSGTAYAVSYSITVQTNDNSYSGAATVTVAGQVSPAPGPNTAVLIRVFNPANAIVTAGEAAVNGTTGYYTFNFVAGGSSAWSNGNYVVNATWGAFGPVVFKATTFSWTSSVVTTTTTTSTTTTTTTTTPSTTTTASSTTSTTTAPPTTSTTSPTTTTTISPSSTTTTSSGGGIPAFPFQALVVAIFTVVVALSYLALRLHPRPKAEGTTPTG
jgi:cell division septation protein DedD